MPIMKVGYNIVDSRLVIAIKMLREVVFTFIFIVLSETKEINKRGEVWPRPKLEEKTGDIFQVRVRNPDLYATGKKCKLLYKAMARTTYLLNVAHKSKLTPNQLNHGDTLDYLRIAKLKVNLLQNCEDYPYLGMNETYELKVGPTSEVKAASIWGIIRGLETFMQLFYYDGDNVYIKGTTIIDYPNYEHRGLMLTTGRLFVPVYYILQILDAMAMNKLNVLHWHICDTKYCPIKSEVYANMSRFETNQYTRDDATLIVAYARERGIRVLPSIDIIGHSSNLRKTFPNIFLSCYTGKFSKVLNPIVKETYEFLKNHLRELNSWFPEDYIHLGGFEANPHCWANYIEINQFMSERNITTTTLLSMFYAGAEAVMAPDMSLIVWQDLYDQNVALKSDRDIIQVWKSNPAEEMIKLLKDGFQVIYSSFLNWNSDFSKYYTEDPRAMVKNRTAQHAVTPLTTTSLYGPQEYDPVTSTTSKVKEKDLPLDQIVGSEICLWSSHIKRAQGLYDRIFPLACALAEALWSDPKDMAAEDWVRLKEHTAHMTRRGIPTKSITSHKGNKILTTATVAL